MSFNLRTASKTSLIPRKPTAFRLEDHITLASSDKYNDPYECEVMARRIRDRYVVSVTITHDPVTTRVYSNSWLYKDMATCWEKYHQIKGIVSDIRDFIEAEGLKSVVFQYMVKHDLSNIGADFENIYETNIPNMRQAIDPSTRGNIIKNLPTVPFLSQSGPDQLDQVYSAVGNAENPVPENNIRGESQLAIPQHQRKQMGLRDVLPSPISKFQEAAGITPNMFKGAASEKLTKTAELADESRKAFVENVKANVSKAVKHGKALAMRHYMAMTGSDEGEAEAFYYGVKAVCSDPHVILNLSTTNLLVFIASAEYKPMFENPALMAKFNHYATRREEAERAIGCFGLSPAYASITMLPQGDRGYGKCSIKLEGLQDDTVLLCGDSFRFRSPARPDYEPDPSLSLYPFSAIADCKATATIIGMTQRDLSGGPANSLTNIINSNGEFGRCEALIFAPIKPQHVSEIITAESTTSQTVRKILMRMGMLMPVVTCLETPDIVYRPADKEMSDDPPMKMMTQKHFCVGDRVATKPMPSMSSYSKVQGTIIDMSDGQVTVEWDDTQRTIFDMVEALSRIMEAPRQSSSGGGMVVYSLPGMDDETVLLLSAAGVDPVSLYSLASHNRPASANATGSLEHMINSMSALGLHGDVIKGYVPAEGGEEAFSPKEWIEAQLATGARLVVDLDPHGLRIKAGETDEYIHPLHMPKVEIE